LSDFETDLKLTLETEKLTNQITNHFMLHCCFSFLWRLHAVTDSLGLIP